MRQTFKKTLCTSNKEYAFVYRMGEFSDKEDGQKTLTILRNKIKKHKDSALKILEDMKKDTIKDSVAQC